MFPNLLERLLVPLEHDQGILTYPDKKEIIKGIWQYKLSLSSLKKH
jgi:hypothetical protein